MTRRGMTSCPICGADIDLETDDRCPSCGTVIDGLTRPAARPHHATHEARGSTWQE